jgi:hypothetical protein
MQRVKIDLHAWGTGIFTSSSCSTHDGDLACHLQVKGLSGTFAEPEGSPLTWRTDSRYSGLNIGVMGIFYEPLQRCNIIAALASQTGPSCLAVMIEQLDGSIVKTRPNYYC